MARCYYLEYQSNGVFSSANDYYYCKLCPMKRMDSNDPQVKHICNPEWGEAYRECPIYKDRRW